MSTNAIAFEVPGIEPHWMSSAKDGIGTAYHSSSCIWFILSHGIVNEIYFPPGRYGGRGQGLGFAVSRTDFWEPLMSFRARNTMREATVGAIVRCYWEFACIFERDRPE